MTCLSVIQKSGAIFCKLSLVLSYLIVSLKSVQCVLVIGACGAKMLTEQDGLATYAMNKPIVWRNFCCYDDSDSRIPPQDNLKVDVLQSGRKSKNRVT